MWNVDPLSANFLEPDPTFDAGCGVRFSTVNFDSNDHYITGSNGDDSGDARYHQWFASRLAQLCVDQGLECVRFRGRGFETLTINELSYRPGGVAGAQSWSKTCYQRYR
ncbi:Uncharacterised protein [Serratia fonticola]|uniref:Uncharacterized protein n=1 Tax=Serratia fonticola TaxID=47917 RepID=A0A4U9U1K4_SERFO|nr:Uncharacterised protein [Serratia fonticola]